MTAIENLIIYFLRILIIIAFYLGVIKALKILLNYAKRYRENKLFNSSEYLPTEEIQTLKQVFFLIVITMSFTIIIYTLISLSAHLFSNYFYVYCPTTCRITGPSWLPFPPQRYSFFLKPPNYLC